MKVSMLKVIAPQVMTRSMQAVLMLMLTAGLAVSVSGKESPETESTVFVDSPDPMQDVQRALDAAKAADKLLLVVMGAQWCHDSRGLAEKFTDPAVAKILADSYETVFVDVGYYKDLRAISQRFEQAHYFATPTVMIINAHTEHLINAQDMHIWGAADRLPASRYVDYFGVYASNPSPQFVPIPDAHASAISLFEQSNAQRLTQAYEVLVPGMLREDNTGQADDDFLRQWREVRNYRMQLQEDIQSIREQATASPDKPLSLPSYEAFSWEDGAQR